MRPSKRDRDIVFNKYGGRCAYCGEPLTKGWHVDHIEPIRRGVEEPTVCRHPELHNPQNLNPACPSCNINKHEMGIEQFRNLISGFVDSLNSRFVQYKIAKRYGLISETGNNVVFYFEKKEA